MHWFFKQQQLPHQILIIEQVEQQLFNRGKLLNIGFVEASRRYPLFSCFDLLPLTDHTTTNTVLTKGPVHLASAVDIFNYWQGKLPISKPGRIITSSEANSSPWFPTVTALCYFDSRMPYATYIKGRSTISSSRTKTDQPTRRINDSSSILMPFSTLFSSRKSQKIAVLVPFRNRYSQLGTFLKHMHSFLKQQQLSYQIFIIEQVEQQLFNCGKLLNIGFVEASKRYPFFTCFVFYDVDLLPLTDHNHIVYNCSDKGPVHLASAIDKFNYKMPYATYFGGACMFTPDQFTKINGFSNKFWGWGGEDDEAYSRTVFTNQEIRHFPPSVLRFKTMKHRKDHNIYYRQHVTLLNNARENRTRMKNYEYDGLSSLNYKLISNVTLPFYVNVTVDLLPKHYYSYNVELINF